MYLSLNHNNFIVGSTTAWPSALSVAATWDTALAYEWGAAMGQEFKAKGANVQLAPVKILHYAYS